MNSKNITVILPVHDVSGDFETWFKKAVTSIEQSQVKPGKLLYTGSGIPGCNISHGNVCRIQV